MISWNFLTIDRESHVFIYLPIFLLINKVIKRQTQLSIYFCICLVYSLVSENCLTHRPNDVIMTSRVTLDWKFHLFMETEVQNVITSFSFTDTIKTNRAEISNNKTADIICRLLLAVDLSFFMVICDGFLFNTTCSRTKTQRIKRHVRGQKIYKPPKKRNRTLVHGV